VADCGMTIAAFSASKYILTLSVMAQNFILVLKREVLSIQINMKVEG